MSDEDYCGRCAYLHSHCVCWRARARATAAAHALGLLGFALAGPSATARAVRMIDSADELALKAGWLAEDVEQGRSWTYCPRRSR